MKFRYVSAAISRSRAIEVRNDFADVGCGPGGTAGFAVRFGFSVEREDRMVGDERMDGGRLL